MTLAFFMLRQQLPHELFVLDSLAAFCLGKSFFYLPNELNTFDRFVVGNVVRKGLDSR